MQEDNADNGGDSDDDPKSLDDDGDSRRLPNVMTYS